MMMFWLIYPLLSLLLSGNPKETPFHRLGYSVWGIEFLLYVSSSNLAPCPCTCAELGEALEKVFGHRLLMLRVGSTRWVMGILRNSLSRASSILTAIYILHIRLLATEFFLLKISPGFFSLHFYFIYFFSVVVVWCGGSKSGVLYRSCRALRWFLLHFESFVGDYNIRNIWEILRDTYKFFVCFPRSLNTFVSLLYVQSDRVKWRGGRTCLSSIFGPFLKTHGSTLANSPYLRVHIHTVTYSTAVLSFHKKVTWNPTQKI